MSLSELAYKLADYQLYKIEPPERILAQPEACEGELMSDDEIWEYCHDSLGVMKIMEDRNPTRRLELAKTFLTDCQFLLKIGRIDDADFEALTIEAGAIEP